MQPAKIHFEYWKGIAGLTFDDHRLNINRLTAVYVSAAYPAIENIMPMKKNTYADCERPQDRDLKLSRFCENKMTLVNIEWRGREDQEKRPTNNVFPLLLRRHVFVLSSIATTPHDVLISKERIEFSPRCDCDLVGLNVVLGPSGCWWTIIGDDKRVQES